ncbi:MAG TPA: hypothetical protein VNA20_09565 [Frankiaceae bacterium]|nr:hypothetical protein [Frankiaceae bacterium]
MPLTRADARKLLLAFLNGVVTAQECDAWANAVEGRDDLDYDDETLVEFLFEIGTPELTRTLTPATAKEWLMRLAAPA